ncbi:MAG: lipocalin-like domain-containing protein [Desulfomonilaceae bacterium]
MTPVQFSFPRDHGQHPSFRTEWWYVAGWVRAASGVEFAYHFTIFRRALERWSDLALVGLALASKKLRESPRFKRALARMLESQNSRRIRVDGYVGHMSLTNLQTGKYVFFERGGTSLLGIADARDDRLGVWVKDWRLYEEQGALHLEAPRHGFAVDLTMRPQKPVALHGDRGLSPKGADCGNASYHYSLPSLISTGAVVWQGARYVVSGKSLMDREYGTGMLPATVRGWDWFGLMLDNDCQALISVIRDERGAMHGCSAAAVSLPDGTVQRFCQDELSIVQQRSWTSPRTGTEYPTAWAVGIRGLDLTATVSAVIQEHELVSATSTTVDYWEGPVRVTGAMAGRRITGCGHVELVGYAQPVGGKF